MIEWTEEDIKFIMNGIINPVTEELLKRDEQTDKTIEGICEIILKHFNKERYDRMRNDAFFLQYLKPLYPNVDINKLYEDYCVKFDERNKHLLEEKMERWEKAKNE